MTNVTDGDVAERLASLAKPPGSLGLLEEWATTLCKVQGTLTPEVDPVSVVVFCADHGVKKADDAISPFPSSVTQAVFRALAAGISGTAVISRSSSAHLTVVDCGIAGDVASVTAGAKGAAIEVMHKKVAEGTMDIRREAAMTDAQLDAALRVGRECVAAEATQRGARCVCVGEVGIGNTTSAAALLATLAGAPAADCCGRGTGLDETGLAHKVATVQAAVDFHAAGIAAAADSSPDAPKVAAAREALRRLGGLETAAMVGAFQEAHERKMVVVVDGFIAATAALCAVRVDPPCRGSMLFATALAEEPQALRGGDLLTRELGAQPALTMSLRLGEGSGAALAVPLLRTAVAVLTQMGTLQEALAL